MPQPHRFETKLKTAEWEVAFDCLRERLPSFDKFVPTIKALSADSIYEVVEADIGSMVWTHWTSPLSIRPPAEIVRVTCRCNLWKSETIYVANDFAFFYGRGPFLTSGKDLLGWLDNYRDHVSNHALPFDGDLIIWATAGVYVFSHERMYASVSFD